MKIYITGLPSGYEVEHLVRLFYPMAPLTLTPPENAEDCVWAEKTPDGLHALVRQDGRSAERHAPLPAPVEQGGETPEFSLASLTYDLLRDWTGIRPFEVIATFEREGLGKYKPQFITSFLEHIANTYINNDVMLSNGMTGKIVLINKHRLTRPVVRLEDGEFINLEKRPELYVQTII